jgi:hypothetical protein
MADRKNNHDYEHCKRDEIDCIEAGENSVATIDLHAFFLFGSVTARKCRTNAVTDAPSKMLVEISEL